MAGNFRIILFFNCRVDLVLHVLHQGNWNDEQLLTVGNMYLTPQQKIQKEIMVRFGCKCRRSLP
jgi:hypothetical protein